MNLRTLRISLLLIILFACNANKENAVKTFYKGGNIKEILVVTNDSVRNGTYKGYYERGNIQEVSDYVDGKLNGIRKFFYEDGKVKGIENYQNDKMNGEFKYFFANGNIETLGFAKNGMVYGKAFNFFEQDSGKVNVVAEFLIVKGKSVRTSYIQYAPNGEIIKTSPSIEIELKDSILINAHTMAKIKLLNPSEKFTHFVIGDFDQDIKDIRIDFSSQVARAHQIEYLIDTSNKGVYYLRGIAIHHSITEKDNELLFSEGEFDIYFEKKYCIY